MSSWRLAIVSVILMSTLACGDGYSSAPTEPSPVPSPTPAPAAPAPTPTPAGPSASVTIPLGAESLGNRAFTPGELSVAAGTTVTWVNTDSVSHTSTSNLNVWNSGIVAPGGQFSSAFATAGTFPYHCAIHPGMVGTIVVR